MQKTVLTILLLILSVQALAASVTATVPNPTEGTNSYNFYIIDVATGSVTQTPIATSTTPTVIFDIPDSVDEIALVYTAVSFHGESEFSPYTYAVKHPTIIEIVRPAQATGLLIKFVSE